MQSQHHRIAIGQINDRRNDVPGTLELIGQQVEQAADAGAKVLVFPELALTGYLVSPDFAEAAIRLDSSAMNELRELSRKLDLCVGFIEETPEALFYNSTAYLSAGRIVHVHRKIYPPTYGVFDERRYFGAGWDVSAFDTGVARSAMLICGDAWHMPLAYMAAHAGADVLYIVAASSIEGLANTTPCDEAWRWMCRSYAITLSCFVVFANLAGEQSDLRFWGGSFVVSPDGNFVAESQTDKADLLTADIDLADLRSQRIKLPFRRDDSLAHTLALGERVLESKINRDSLYGERPQDRPPAPKPR